MSANAAAGLKFDWSRKSPICDPDYQVEPVAVLKCSKRYASIASTQVNWDPVDQTVLANEQVIDGKGCARRTR
jgi:leucyl-tRNA synthetase